jgi:hypothetical protein
VLHLSPQSPPSPSLGHCRLSSKSNSSKCTFRDHRFILAPERQDGSHRAHGSGKAEWVFPTVSAYSRSAEQGTSHCAGVDGIGRSFVVDAA